MAIKREQIEHIEYWLKKYGFIEKPWKQSSHSRKWLKKQLNKFMRIKNKNIRDDDTGYKQGKKYFYGYEY